MKTLERSIKQWLRERDIYFGKRTKIDQLEAFFQRVYPVTTNHELVRIGEKMDGGYLLPDDLDQISACFSPGVSLEVHFEEELSKKGIRSFMADYSVDSLPHSNPEFDFEKKFLGMENDDIYITLDRWVTDKIEKDDGDLILQMDIEGAEYDVIFDASNELLKRFRIIIIEFHRLDSLLDKFGYQIINAAFRKLLKNFEIVHIHPNNQTTVTKYKMYEFPSEMEFTFFRKDRINQKAFASSYPHELDAKNIQDGDDLVLPRCWFSAGPS